MTGYELSRDWFNFCFDNPEKVKPNHTALYFFIIEHCNRLGWKQKFGLPTEMAKEAIGIKSYNTFIDTLRDLIDWKFIIIVEKSKNQYSSNIISISKFNEVNAISNNDKALDKAMIKHGIKQSESTDQCTYQSICSINKLYNNKLLTNNIKLITDNLERVIAFLSEPKKDNLYFITFWDQYHLITGLSKTDKEATEKYWKKLKPNEQEKAINNIKLYYDSLNDKKYCKKARTYLDDKNFNDEFGKPKTTELLDKFGKPRPSHQHTLVDKKWTVL